MQIWLPLSSVWPSLVALRPSGVVSLQGVKKACQRQEGGGRDWVGCDAGCGERGGMDGLLLRHV